MTASLQCKMIGYSFEEDLINDFDVSSGANKNDENICRWNDQKEELTIVCDDKCTLSEFSTHYCFSASDNQQQSSTPNQQESHQNILSESLNLLNESIQPQPP